ncbi:sulfotransferase ssu-1 [Ixodes scapularis]|uniref:sulfotransferase ssu-1 n=1 Tax=Ixodes scapularis TaxID=6945 RepID=UPI001A9E8469|nr:sulfotransferase ssu-1 [Ixodes scapularis]
MSSKRVPVYQDIDGVKYSLGYKVNLVREALSYMPHDGDIVMVSPLKCGNNWLEQIMQLILYRGQSANDLTEYNKRTPYIEMVGTDPLKDMHPPRFFKTHFSYERQPMNPKAKYVYLTRNPLDVCVSFYHFTRSVPVYRFKDGTFDDFFELFVTGQNDRGDFFDHLMSWYPHKDDINVFFVTYEELKRNFRNTVLRLARFLGEEYAKPLESNELFQKVVEQSSLSFMSQFLMITEEKMRKLVEKGDKDMLEATKRFAFDGSDGFLNKSVLVRKGIVGDWKTLFKEEHLEQLRLRIHEKNVAPALKALWSSEDLGGVV